MRSGFVLLVFAILFYCLLPQQTLPRSWAGPEMVSIFAFAWVIRRPEFVPMLLLGALLLLADLLLSRPPGLWALLVLLAAERLRARSLALRDSTLIAECAEVALLIVGISVLYMVVLSLLLVEGISPTLIISQAIATILVYPVVVFATHVGMGVRKPVPGELDARGVRT